MGTTSRVSGVIRAAGIGAVAGLAGGSAMVVGEKVEQAITRRPNSYVPGRVLLTLLGRRPTDADKPFISNHLMHYATAALLGALRGVWAAVGIRGVYANAWHSLVRLGFDQTVENATGVGAPPHTWPRRELVVDVLHKVVFAVITGIVADRMIRPHLVSTRGRTSH
ncbi:hypothetical protein A7J15_10325 [Microbacterium sediminis]|uniref:Uncharacterized protein n=2 Tax=Microbacterium TaxID=33882 RepID=A0A1B9N8L5_9MICO|nr:hypothetical protein A7J15_10325 [Microbacterium sediminis]QBR73439.1 hypothetical protein E3O41_02675 [Microbacterium sediminis]